MLSKKKKKRPVLPNESMGSVSFIQKYYTAKQSGPQGNSFSIAVTRSQTRLCWFSFSKKHRCLALLSPSAISDNQMLL